MLYNVTGLSDGTENSSAGAPLNSVLYSPNRYLDGDGQRLKEGRRRERSAPERSLIDTLDDGRNVIQC